MLLRNRWATKGLPMMLLTMMGSLDRSWGLNSNPEENPQDISYLCSDSGNRPTCEIQLDVPAACVNADGISDCPIVFFLHGSGGTIQWFSRTSKVHEHNVIGVYPQGEGGWNTGPKDTNQCEWTDFDCDIDPDEGLLIKNIIDFLVEDGAVGHVYVTGNSNGAALAHRLAANAGDALPIKGIITKVTQLLETPERSGPGVYNYNQPSNSSWKVSVLNIMGTQDALIPYNGGSSAVFGDYQNDFVLMPALDSMVAWAEHNQCDTTPITTISISDMADGIAYKYVYPNCAEGIFVEHYAIQGAGHGAGGASIDGVKIDYDLTYQFIQACESNDSGGDGGSTPCEDDADWQGKHSAEHTCAYVSLIPDFRCTWEDSNGILAEDACPVACGTCSTNSPVTTPVSPPTVPPTTAPVSPPTVPPTTAPVSPPTTPPTTTFTAPPTVTECLDDTDWHGQYDPYHDCIFISQNPDARCRWVDSDGVSAMDACKLACGTC